MLTRSSTWSSAGSSVLKSKWVIRVEVRLLADVRAVEDLAEALVGRVVAELRPVDLVAEVGRPVDQAEVPRVELVEETFAPELLQQRLVFASAVRFGMIDSYVTTKLPVCIVPSIAPLMHCSKYAIR